MKRTVEEYMALPYTIEITPDNGTFFVKIKELQGCMSVGETKADALAMIEDAMREWLVSALEDSIEIPLPEAVQADRYSGKFPLRLPKSLHRKLAENAEMDKVSLNQYMVMLLSERNAITEVRRLLSKPAAKTAQPHRKSHASGYIAKEGKLGKVAEQQTGYLHAKRKTVK